MRILITRETMRASTRLALEKKKNHVVTLPCNQAPPPPPASLSLHIGTPDGRLRFCGRRSLHTTTTRDCMYSILAGRICMGRCSTKVSSVHWWMRKFCQGKTCVRQESEAYFGVLGSSEKFGKWQKIFFLSIEWRKISINWVIVLVRKWWRSGMILFKDCSFLDIEKCNFFQAI